ncbi:TonB-dependent receptor [Sandaracinobacter neustonicus]|uniref:TonB-dependent receptor n=2 Tax=Sandaracinobacter neustonicus TaxID=1715348 RepID=A0A501XQ09_9SPHN|nr:TonB-dependent receptor [Sandaracinobacter neustonicus]
MLLGGTSLLVLGAGFAAPVRAQAAPAAEAPADESEIVVTGLRESATQARNIKKNAEVIVDSITAADIGALPDRSVSEALQRIPGVTLQRTNEARDPARLAAEGGGIFVRGLSWVRSELNGRDVFSASNGRGLSFEDISADLMAGVDVYKNPSADMIEGGVGGLVNLRTRKPLSEPGQIIAASGDYNYADLRKKGFWSASGLYTNKWDVAGGEFGVLFSGSINNIGNRTDSIQLGRYDPITPTGGEGGNALPNMPAGETFYIPNTVGYRRIDWEQRRIALNGVVQASPTPGMTFTFEGVYARATPRDLEYGVGAVTNPATGTSPSYVFDDRNVLVGGELTAEPLVFNTRNTRQTKVTQDYSINWHYEVDDRWTLSADFQRVYSTAKIMSMTAFTQFGVQEGWYNGSRPNLSWDTSGNSPSMSITENGASLSDKSNYWWYAAMDHLEDNEAGSWAQRADVEYKFDDNSFLKSFRAGVRATQKNAITRQTGWNWGLLSQAQWGGGPNAVFLDQTGNPSNAGLPDQAAWVGYSNFFRGKIAAPTGGWFATPGLTSNNISAYDYLKSTRTVDWSWRPLTEDSYTNATPAVDNVSAGITSQNEKTKAAYALLRFGSPDSGGAGSFDGNIGVRVVRTENDTSGVLLLNRPTVTMQTCLDNHPGNAAACAPLAQAYAFTDGQLRFPDQKFSNTYTNWLPTFNFRYFATDEVQLRFAAGQAMVRPSFAQMVPFNSLSFTFLADGTPDPTLPRVGVGGNPYLKPTISTQVDLSAEWYHGTSNSVTLALFYKDIKDFVYAGSVEETFVNNGVSMVFDVTRNMNGPSGKVKGLELAVQQFADFLPGGWSGLAVQANYTFVDSSGGANLAVNSLDPNQTTASNKPLPLEGMSKHSYNLALMYEKFGVSARLAYNWRSKYLLTTSAANLNAPVWFEDYGQLDGSFIYSINDNIKVGVQGTNLLNSRTYLQIGNVGLTPRYSWTDTDRRIAFLVRTRF